MKVQATVCYYYYYLVIQLTIWQFFSLMILPWFLWFSLLEHLLNLVSVKGSAIISAPILINFEGIISTPMEKIKNIICFNLQ